MTRIRKEKFDNRRRVDLNDTQSEWLDRTGDELDISMSAVIRKLINEKMKLEKEVSLNNRTETTAILEKSRAPSNGLYTAEQVAQLINAVTKK